MRTGYFVGLLGLAAIGALSLGASAQTPSQSAQAPRQSAQTPGQCTPASIGLARTIEIDTRGGPRFGQNQYPGQSSLRDREVILTFDDGPHKTLTQPILDALDAHCTKATFFMVGQRALSYPEIVRLVARRGHTIGTHTWTHQDLAKISTGEATDEIELGISAVQKALGGAAAPFFRYPYLSDPKEMTAHLKARNTAIFSIDVDSYDFKTRSPTVVTRNVMQQLEAKGRGIILFHDIQPSTADALNVLLSEMKAKGFRVVHMVPRQGQTTVAEYDQKVGKGLAGRRIASLPISVQQRGIVSPAWEVRVYQGAGAAAPGAAPPVKSPPPRPSRRSDEDWKSSIFRSW